MEPKRTSYEEVMPVVLNNAQNRFQSEFNYEIESKKIRILFFFLPSFFFSHFFFFLFFFLTSFSFFSLFFFSLSFFFSPSFQDKLDKMQIVSSEDVNDLNYYYDNEWWVACGGN